MPDESTTPDLVELTRRAYEAAGRREFDAMMGVFGPNAVWEGALGTFEGRAAIRGFLEDWSGAFEQFEVELEQALDLGNGVTFATVSQGGRPPGVSGHMQMRYAVVGVWVDGMIARVMSYTDIDEARVAAERLAEERG
jgi:ketosteroid isomerase-like protein